MDVVEQPQRASADCEVRDHLENEKVSESDKSDGKGSPKSPSNLEITQELGDGEKGNDLPNAETKLESNPTTLVAPPDELTANSSSNDTPIEAIAIAEKEVSVSAEKTPIVATKESENSCSEKLPEVQVSTSGSEPVTKETVSVVSESKEDSHENNEKVKDGVPEPEAKVKEEVIPPESDSELSSGEKHGEGKDDIPESEAKFEGKDAGSDQSKPDTELISGEMNEKGKEDIPESEAKLEGKDVGSDQSKPDTELISGEMNEGKSDVAKPEATKQKEAGMPPESDSELSSGDKHEEPTKSVRFSEEVVQISSPPSSEPNTDPDSHSKEATKTVRFAEEDSEIGASALDSDVFHDAGDVTTDLPSLEDSEYETPEPEDDDIEKEDDEDESNASESGESSAGSQVLTEREEGDGQESEKKDKKLDHDEDKRDPQYIPKKGNFYEHDDRTSETDEVAQKKPLPQKPYETKERWNHDLYDDDLQSPKSRQELIDQYGYDIRQEEGPPKARRRRRYGRGPNKYTRSWEEMEAYTKTRGSWRGRGRGRPNPTPRNTEEEFPPLPSRKLSDRLQKKSEKKTEEKKEEPPPPVTPPPQKKETPPPRKAEPKEEKEKKDAPQPQSVKKTFKQVYVEEQVIVPSSRGRGRGRGRLPPGAPFKSQNHQSQNHHHHQQNHPKQSTAEEDIATLSQHFSEAVINVDNKSIMPISQQPPPQQQQSRASSLPPTSTTTQSSSAHAPTAHTPASQAHPHSSERTHEDRDAMIEKSESKSKRYSTQRQRSLPQGSPQVQQPPPPPQVQQPPQRYIQDQFFHQGMEPNPAPPPPPQFAQPPPPAPQFTPEVPMMAFIPPGGQFQPLYVPPPPYLPPAPLPVQAPPPVRPEVYQGASGITYYNTQTQVNRPVSTSRRVKLAIPIVAPPEPSS